MKIAEIKQFSNIFSDLILAGKEIRDVYDTIKDKMTAEECIAITDLAELYIQIKRGAIPPDPDGKERQRMILSKVPQGVKN